MNKFNIIKIQYILTVLIIALSDSVIAQYTPPNPHLDGVRLKLVIHRIFYENQTGGITRDSVLTSIDSSNYYYSEGGIEFIIDSYNEIYDDNLAENLEPCVRTSDLWLDLMGYNVEGACVNCNLCEMICPEFSIYCLEGEAQSPEPDEVLGKGGNHES